MSDKGDCRTAPVTPGLLQSTAHTWSGKILFMENNFTAVSCSTVRGYHAINKLPIYCMVQVLQGDLKEVNIVILLWCIEKCLSGTHNFFIQEFMLGGLTIYHSFSMGAKFDY